VSALALALPCTAETNDAAARFSAAWSAGQRAGAAGAWVESVTHYRQALQLEPGHAQARFELARALRESRLYFEARRNFRLALQANAADRAWVSQCRLQMAACFEATGDYSEAAAEYRLALEFDANCAEARSGERRALAQVTTSESK
jgi:tetratricopeptide (TPR) repeat protein